MRMTDYEIEYNKLTEEIAGLNMKISTCPRGNLRKRVIRGKEYYYLQYREGQRVKSHYVKADEVPGVLAEIEERKTMENDVRELQNRLKRYESLIGKHRKYRPVKDVDYKEYTLFMSTVAHDHKSMDRDSFLEKYKESKYRGLNKRYLSGFLDYISGIERQKVRKTNDLVLDPYTYLMYFKYGDKDVLGKELERAIPAFLSRGLLITNVQEAVNGSLC